MCLKKHFERQISVTECELQHGGFSEFKGTNYKLAQHQEIGQNGDTHMPRFVSENRWGFYTRTHTHINIHTSRESGVFKTPGDTAESSKSLLQFSST